MPLDQPNAVRVPGALRVAFDNTYARLPNHLFARHDPVRVAAPKIVRVNRELAALLGIDPDALDADMLSGNRVPEGAEPLAQAYAGHQFGYFSPQLGDGRAILLGEVVATDGKRYDIQLKGSGRTPFSRGGDGKASIGPVLREYLLGEGMHALGIPTTRALAAVTTGEHVRRETALPGAVLTRVAASHLRVGTFQFFAARGDVDAVRTLADYAIARHYPGLDHRAFLEAVIARQADLVAQWMLVGFIHGVMNTDNMAISGETIDYGPCAFMDTYDPETVFSSIDEAGRYAYGRQPRIAAWNLARLAEALLPLLGPDRDAGIAAAQAALATFAPRFEAAYLAGLRRKIGLATEQQGDDDLAQDLLRHMQESGADWTQTFRTLAEDGDLTTLGDWPTRWRARRAQEPEPLDLTRINPVYIPRNHLVEAALNAAIASADYTQFQDLLAVITDPYERRPGLDRFAQPPRPEERVLATFCGT